MSHTRAADDFATIRARMEELRRVNASDVDAGGPRRAEGTQPSRDADFERRRQARIEGRPQPWVPTIFMTGPGR